MFVSEKGTIINIPLVLSVELVDVHVPAVIIQPDIHLAKLTLCDKTAYFLSRV